MNQYEKYDKCNERQKIGFFLRGLRVETRMHVNIMRPTTLLKAIEIATKCEETMRTAKQINNVEGNNNNKRHRKRNNRNTTIK